MTDPAKAPSREKCGRRSKVQIRSASAQGRSISSPPHLGSASGSYIAHVLDVQLFCRQEYRIDYPIDSLRSKYSKYSVTHVSPLHLSNLDLGLILNR